MKKTKIITLVNANIYDGTLDMKLQENAMIEITNDTITNVGKFNVNPFSKIIDLKGKFVVPGLINLHSHIPNSGKIRKKKLGDVQKLVKFITSSFLTIKIGLMICKPQLKASVNSGITTIRTVGGIDDFDSILRNKINAGKMLGPRMLVSNFAIGVEGGHMVGTVAKAVRNKEEIIRMIDELNSQKVDLIKIMITGGVLDGKKPGNPGQLAMSKEFVQICCDYSHKLGLKVAAHVEGSEGMNIGMECGLDSIEHSAPFDDKLGDAYAKHGGAIVITLSPAKPFIDLDPNLSGYGEIAQINSKIIYDGMIKAYHQATKHGITVGLGTDAGSTLVPHYNFYKELILFSSECGVSKNFALHTATLVNAKIAGIDQITGSIEKNKKADLLIVDNDPILDLENLGKPVMVFANGNLINKPKVKRLEKEDQLLRLVKFNKNENNA